MRVVRETLQLDASGVCLFSYLLKAEPDGTATGFVALVLRMLRPIAPSLGPLSSASSPLPYPYRVIGMVMIGFGGSHVLQISDGRHLNPPGGHLGKPEAPGEERPTDSFLLLLRFLRSCMRRLGVHTWYSDSGDDLQVPRHTGCPLHRRREEFVPEPYYVRLSGAEEGSLLLLLLWGWLSLACSSHPLISINPQVEVAQKA